MPAIKTSFATKTSLSLGRKPIFFPICSNPILFPDHTQNSTKFGKQVRTAGNLYKRMRLWQNFGFQAPPTDNEALWSPLAFYPSMYIIKQSQREPGDAVFFNAHTCNWLYGWLVKSLVNSTSAWCLLILCLFKGPLSSSLCTWGTRDPMMNSTKLLPHTDPRKAPAPETMMKS